MARLRISGFHCNDETTSGWSARRRRIRRNQFSDELLFLIGVFPFNNDGEYIHNGEFHYRITTGVDSNEDHNFSEQIIVSVDNSTSPRFDVRVWGFELDGAGSSENLGKDLSEKIENLMRFDIRTGDVPTYNPMPTADLGERINGADHDLVFADLWQVRSNATANGGFDPIIRSTRTSVDVSGWLRRHGIESEVRLFNPMRGSQRTERRQYLRRSERSDYRFDVHYTP